MMEMEMDISTGPHQHQQGFFEFKCPKKDSLFGLGGGKQGQGATEHLKEGGHPNFPLEIRDDPVLGRHLVAPRDFEGGECILREQAMISGPNFLEEGLPVCLSCYSLVNSNYLCSNCRWPLCNSKCEKDNKHAAFECPVFASNGVSSDQFMGNSSITILRCLLLKEKNPKKWSQILKLESHQEARTENPNAMALLCAALTFIQQICGLEHFDYDLIDFVTGVVDVNELGAEDRQGALLYRYGSYLYQTGSLLSHACIPNAHRVISLSSDLEVYASVPIKKGQVISTIYGESFLGTKERNQILGEMYYFSCGCNRCLDPTESATYLQALKCQANSSCKLNAFAYLLPIKPTDPDSQWKCSHCAQMLEDANVSAIKDAFREEVEQIGSDRSMEKVLKLEALAGKHRGVTFHPNHFLIFRTEYDIIQRMSYILYKNKLIRFQVEFIQRFIELTRKILTTFDILLPGFNRHRGRVLYFLQQGLLYLLQYKVNPNCIKRLDAKARAEAPKEFQEFERIRREGKNMLGIEAEGSEEGLLAKEMADSNEVEELRRVLGQPTTENNNVEVQAGANSNGIQMMG